MGPLNNKWMDDYFEINSIIVPDILLKNALNKIYKEKFLT